MEIKGILVTALAPFENHIANGGEKLLGNASSIKRRPDGRVYISGQMQRHVFFSAIDRINLADENRGETFVSNGDGISNQIENDLRADMGGFMHPSKGDYSGRRTAPLSVTPAVAIDESEVRHDLLIRIKNNIRGEKYIRMDILLELMMMLKKVEKINKLLQQKNLAKETLCT